MKCSSENCNKWYDLKCLAIEQQLFEDFTEGYKEQWVCPECHCANPKRNNVDTPVRTPGMTKNCTTSDNYVSDNYVNMQRGSRSKVDARQSESESECETELLVELRLFRKEVTSRLDNQTTAIKQLHDLYYSVKTDLNEMQTKMRVIEEKINCDFKQNTTIDGLRSLYLQSKNIESTVTKEQPRMAPSIMDEKNKKTYAGVTGGSSKSNETKSQSGATKIVKGGFGAPVETLESMVIGKQVNNHKKISKGGAMKIVQEPPIEKNESNIRTQSTDNDRKEEENEDNWTLVRNKQKRLQSKEIVRGQNTSITQIQAIERLKHLHVWRLHPETTVENLSSYVKDVCGFEAKVEKVNHKTERGYASFIVSVSEKVYNQLSQPSIWPMNTEFSEWIWFRRYDKQPYKTNQTN